MSSHRSAITFALFAAALSLEAGTGPGVADAAVLVLEDHRLPAAFRMAFDVRWSRGDNLALAVFETGVVELAAGRVDNGTILVPADRYDDTGVWRADRLALSSDFIAVAAGYFELKWRPIAGGPLAVAPRFEGIFDIDLDGDRLLAVGVRREGPKAELAPDAAIAWLGTLAQGLGDLRPVRYSQSGPGARRMVACGGFLLGRSRFLPGGSFVIVPGAEPGIYFHERSGAFSKAWETESLGIGVACDFDREKELLYGADPNARWAYMEQFRVVDEILPWDDGFALIVKRIEEGETRWELVVFEISGGAPTRFDLPIRSPSRLSHLRGDRRGDRLALLVWEDVRPNQLPPDAAPRLLFADVVREPNPSQPVAADASRP